MIEKILKNRVHPITGMIFPVPRALPKISLIIMKTATNMKKIIMGLNAFLKKFNVIPKNQNNGYKVTFL